MERPFLAQRTSTVVPVRVRQDGTVAGRRICWADVVAGWGGSVIAIAEEEGDGRQQNCQRRDGHGDGHAEVRKERSQQQSARRRTGRIGEEFGWNSRDGKIRRNWRPSRGRHSSLAGTSPPRRKVCCGGDSASATIHSVESAVRNRTTNCWMRSPPSRPSQFQNGRRAAQLINFFFFPEEFRRRSFGFGRHQIAGRTVAHSVAGGRQREFVLAAAVQVADWDGPPSGRKDSFSPFVLLEFGRPTGTEFEDKRSDGRDLLRRPVVVLAAAGHGPLECDGRGIGCGESEVRGRRGDDDGQQIVDPMPWQL